MNREKYDFENQVPSEGRYKANQRERVRTYRYLLKPFKLETCVNTAFTMLRNLIPTDPADRKLSKIETLKLACCYISHLGSILLTGSCEVSTSGNFICTFCVTSAKIKTDLYKSILD